MTTQDFDPATIDRLTKTWTRWSALVPELDAVLDRSDSITFVAILSDLARASVSADIFSESGELTQHRAPSDARKT